MNRRFLLKIVVALAFWIGVPLGSIGQESQRTDRSQHALQWAERILSEEIAESSRKLEELRNRIPPKTEELQVLIDRLKAVQVSQQPPEPAPEEASARRVRYRPPLLHTSTKPGTSAVVCQDQRVTVVALTAVNEARRTMASEGKTSVQQGHFDIRPVAQRGRVLGVELVRKAGHPGETVSALQHPGSEIMQLLRTANPSKTTIQFAVYHDSFDIFRQIRVEAWKRNFETRWIPMESGEAILIGGSGENLVD